MQCVLSLQYFYNSLYYTKDYLTLFYLFVSQDSLYHHPVHKISFIAQDMTDSRAFGYIFGSPDTGHRFFGIKTDKAASQVSMNIPIIKYNITYVNDIYILQKITKQN